MASPMARAARCAGLLTLPHDVLEVVASHLGVVELLSLAGVCRACRAAAESDAVWLARLERRMRPQAVACFGGALPEPHAMCAKRHFFHLCATWKALAQVRTGRLLVQVGTPVRSGRAPHELKSLLWDAGDVFLGRERPATYGIYDVTAFLDDHPGAAEILQDAAREADATCVSEGAINARCAAGREHGKHLLTD